MDGMKRALLEQAGVDVDEALGRFMGSEGLMMKFLLRFPQDENFARLCQAMEAGDAGQAFEAAHTLKGVAGNLSITGLFRQAGALVEDLRGGDLEGAREKLPALEAQYAQVTQALAELTLN